METVDLLWRHRIPAAVRRGRPPKLTTDQVVTGAIKIADRAGLAFTLRDTADALRVPVMSLYSYIDSREQLLELMIDQCRTDMAYTEPAGDWRSRLSAVASDNLRLLSAHPWMAGVESERAILGPGTLAKYERELAAVEPLPLPDTAKDATLTLVLDFVRSCARSIDHALQEREQQTPQQWWEHDGAQLARLGVADRYPLASRIGTATGETHGAANDAHAAYTFGLDVIFQGIEATATH